MSENESIASEYWVIFYLPMTSLGWTLLLPLRAGGTAYARENSSPSLRLEDASRRYRAGQKRLLVLAE